MIQTFLDTFGKALGFGLGLVTAATVGALVVLAGCIILGLLDWCCKRLGVDS